MATWKIDPSHSDVQFKVKHLMITTVTGQFAKFDATMETTGNDFSTANITFEADVDSISTQNAQRDQHLQAADFFEAATYPKLTFVSKEVKKVDDDSYKVTGDLTIKGNTRPVELNVEFGGEVVDPYGQTKAGFELSGKINRKDFGLTFHATTETGGLLLSDEVRLLASVQMVKQQ
ncbi:Polyisoprenoid-binding protein YceI [Chitinophaga terrae (ex Kim and Jung 2007)]|uniref:Polyisoprenoid-binding protein YceI n=1 Tax=Chitinophaga terrae (ex Kim and Jung 2007) TaxID=408074 RepID=A0A1H4CNE5_9BACT|nr:YceI family protein [Chitinophaga terrae (ex Kim and Jung 2007)]SEA61839.1 Polyisoprenoid-binding protein YceI [Chitinophaga terrae (ex Kim and Jung 2007)]